MIKASNQLVGLLKVVILVGLFHGLIQYYYCYGQEYNGCNKPLLAVVSRDIFLLTVISYLLIYCKFTLYIKNIRPLIFSAVIFLAISVVHASYGFIDVIHYNIRNILLYLLLFLLIQNIQFSDNQLKIIAKFFNRLSLYVCLIGIFTSLNEDLLTSGRVFSTLYDPIIAGYIFGLSLLMTIGELIYNKENIFYCILRILILIYGIILTGSYGSIATAVFSILFLIILDLRNINLIKLKNLFIGAMIFLCFIFTYMAESFLSRTNLIFFNNHVTSISGRLNQYKLFSEDLIHGELSEILFGKYVNEYITSDGVYLQLFHNVGIIGILCVIVIILNIVYCGYLNTHFLSKFGINSYTKIITVVVISYLISSLFVIYFTTSIISMYPANLILFLFCGLIVSAFNNRFKYLSEPI